ncbi:MAG: hypothetical protein WC478_06205 [Candidatus Omnitrophota bacterium]
MKEEEKKICPLCKLEKSANIVDICVSAHQYIIRRIKDDHPDWVEEDGACPKCVEYYRNLEK